MTPFAFNRRQMLARTSTGFGILGLAGVLAQEAEAVPASPTAVKAPHHPAKAKRVIHLFMNGGPSQVDTFDPKPVLTKNNGKKPGDEFRTTRSKGAAFFGSPFKFKKYGQSGIEVSELFPKVGECIDDICVLRGMHTNVPNHEPSLLMMNSGNTQPIRPSYGSWLGYGLGNVNQNLPGFVVLCPGKPVVGPQLWSNSFLPGIYQGCHIANLDPKRIIEHIENTNLGKDSQRAQIDLLNELNRMHCDTHDGDDQLEARIQSFEMAFRMQTEAREAFDMTKEKQTTRDAYGKSYFGNACLTARRLVERGVRTVQIYYGGGQPWDDHGNLEKGHRDKSKDADQAISALLKDLKELGMLEDTLVLWGGEFGRTPTSQGANGRDHNNAGFSVWMAGGGIKGGMTYGATDDFGFAAVEDKMHVHDLHATILHLMGLDHEKLTYRYSGRDFRLTDVHGRVVKEILA